MLSNVLDAGLRRACREFEIADGPPFAIIGMHRSGTSVVTRILREAGGYFGYRLDPNSEAVVFLKFNHSFLAYANASWDCFPSDFHADKLSRKLKVVLCFLSNKNLLWSEFFDFYGERGTEEDGLRGDQYRLPIWKLRDILGPRKQRRTIGKNSVPFWGWKDPRTTMTLSVWLKIFPSLKVIHVVRNGVDVALSLWRRSQKSGEGAPRCLNLHYCFDLWEKYVREGCKWRLLGEDRYIEVLYEDLVAEPVEAIKRLLSFAGVPAWKATALSKWIETDRPGRGVLKERNELIELGKCSKVFQDLGYARWLPGV